MHSIRSIGGILILTAGFNVARGQDTIHVRAAAPLWGTSVGVAPLYTLGSAPDYRIRIFYGMAVDKLNRVYIHDLSPQEGNPHVDAYDANGNYLRTIGRQGSGPGEYRTIFGLAVIQDSILAAWDASNARITEWNPDGSLVRTIPLDRSYTGTSWFGIKADMASLMYLRHRTWLAGPDGRPAPVQPPEGRPIFVRFRPDGTIADSLLAPEIPELPDKRLSYGSYISWDNFVPNVSITPTAMGGLVYGRGDNYSFTIQPDNKAWTVSDSRATATPTKSEAPKRVPIRVVDKDWKPVPLTSEERSEWEAYIEFRKSRDKPPVDYTVPKTKPAYKDLFVDADGRIWVNLYAPASKRELPARDPKLTSPRIYWLQQPVYDVFDPNGRYLGNVTMPYRTGTLVQAKGDRVWFHGLGPDDEHLIIAYRLTGIRAR